MIDSYFCILTNLTLSIVALIFTVIPGNLALDLSQSVFKLILHLLKLGIYFVEV